MFLEPFIIKLTIVQKDLNAESLLRRIVLHYWLGLVHLMPPVQTSMCIYDQAQVTSLNMCPAPVMPLPCPVLWIWQG